MKSTVEAVSEQLQELLTTAGRPAAVRKEVCDRVAEVIVTEILALVIDEEVAQDL